MLPSVTDYETSLETVFFSWSSADITEHIPFWRGTRSPCQKQEGTRAFMVSILDVLFVPRVGSERGRAWCKVKRGKRALDSLGMIAGGSFQKKVSLYWKRIFILVTQLQFGSRPAGSWKRKSSRCWSLSGSGDSILSHRVLEDGGKHYYTLFHRQFMGYCSRQESRSDGLFFYELLVHALSWILQLQGGVPKVTVWKASITSAISISLRCQLHYWELCVCASLSSW